MRMAGKTFEAQLQDIEDLTIEGMTRTARSALTDVATEFQQTQIGIGQGATSFVEGAIPVDTSALANSLTVDDTNVNGDATAKIAGLEIGDTMVFKWTEPYARRIEYGFTGTDSLGRTFNVPGRFFMTRAAEKFPEFVKKRAAEVRR